MAHCATRRDHHSNGSHTLRVLIVDDEIAKATEISRTFADAGLDISIDHVTTAVAARKHLKSSKYAIVVIDLHLPAAILDAPSGNGGFDLLDLINLDITDSSPSDIIFITGREELLVDAREKALQRGAMLFEYSKSSEWKKYIIGRARYLKSVATQDLRRNIDIAVITALHSPELDAALGLPYNWRSERFAGDPTNYHFGHFQNNTKSINIVAACASRKGMPSSAALASHLVSKFRPKYIVMLGICAGIPGKTNFGDVVIGDPTWDYGSGKRAVDKFKSAVFQVAPYQAPLSSEIRSLAEQLARDPQVMQAIRGKWPHEVPEGTLSAYVGPMASGASVVADDEQARLVALQQREVLAIEMEAYAVMAAMEYAAAPKPTAIAIKSVCDFADSQKNDKWQKYAAYTSAAFAERLFSHPAFEV